MSLTLAGRNIALPTLLPGTLYIALHTGNPGDAGSANQLADGSYTRQPTAFAVNTSTGTAASSSALNFTLSATATLTHISIWTAASGGTCVSSQPLTAPVSASAGTFTIAAGDINLGGVSP